jgi:predicted HTH domain antitoxin
MTLVSLILPDDLSTALHIPVEGLGAEIAFAAAARLYEEGRVSLAKAAQIAGVERFAFSARLAASGIPTATFDIADADVARAAAR